MSVSFAKIKDIAAPLKIKDVKVLWFAKLSSEIGDWVARLALAALVLERTGSATFTALVTVVSLLPWLGIGQWLSTYADRVPYKQIMIGSDIISCLIFLLLAWIPLPTSVVLLLAFAAACTVPPFEAARAAALPQASKDQYGKALVLFNATGQTGLLLGFLMGGALLALVGPTGALTLNSVTFLVSASLVYRLSNLQSEKEDTSARAQMKAGFFTLWNDLLLRRSLLLLFLAAGSCMAGEALAVVVAAQLNNNSTEVAPLLAGLLAAAVPTGALLATLILPSDGNHKKLVQAGAFATFILALGSGLLILLAHIAAANSIDAGLSFLPTTLAVLGFVGLGAISAVTIPFGAVLGYRLPNKNRASAFSIAQGGVMSFSGIFALLSGILADQLGSLLAVSLLTLPALVGAVVVLKIYRDAKGTADKDDTFTNQEERQEANLPSGLS